MTNDEILQAAKEAEQALYNRSFTAYFSVIERLVRETEKRTIERCANECNDKLIPNISFAEHFAIKLCASAIRKLGEQE